MLTSVFETFFRVKSGVPKCGTGFHKALVRCWPKYELTGSTFCSEVGSLLRSFGVSIFTTWLKFLAHLRVVVHTGVFFWYEVWNFLLVVLMDSVWTNQVTHWSSSWIKIHKYPCFSDIRWKKAVTFPELKQMKKTWPLDNIWTIHFMQVVLYFTAEQFWMVTDILNSLCTNCERPIKAITIFVIERCTFAIDTVQTRSPFTSAECTVFSSIHFSAKKQS